ncbi:MAG: hypothetical protein AAGJ93_11855, partial [Bacteroidota bacterium]
MNRLNLHVHQRNLRSDLPPSFFGQHRTKTSDKFYSFLLPFLLLMLCWTAVPLSAAVPDGEAIMMPQAELIVSLTSADDVCTDLTDVTSCTPNITGDPHTYTAEPGETIYFEYDVTNTGSTT